MSPLFKLVFATVVALVVVAIGINVALVFAGTKGTMAEDLASTCQDTWRSGAAAIFGLIVGKAT